MKNCLQLGTLAILLVLLTGPSTFGQSNSPVNSWSLDFVGGIPYTQFTVSTDAMKSPEYGLGLRYNFNPDLALRADFQRGVFHGTESGAFDRDYRNTFYRYGLKAEFILLRSDVTSIGLFAGLEGYYSDVNAMTASGAPGQYSGVSGTSNDMGFGAGAQLRFNLSDHLDFMLQAEQHITSSRNFDGYSQEVTSGGQTFTQNYLDRFISMSAGFTIKFGKDGRPHQLWNEQDPSDEISRLKSRVEIVETRLSKQDESDDRLFKRLAGLQDSLATMRRTHADLQQKHSHMLDSLQAKLADMQSEAATKKQKEIEDQRKPKGNYYIIAASFDQRQNAVEYAKRLLDQGISESRIIPPGQGSNYYKVSYTLGLSRSDANRLLRDRYKIQNSAAWLMNYDGRVMTVN